VRNRFRSCKFSLIGCDRKTLLILDKVGRIVAVLVGQPDDPEWVYVIKDAAEVLEEVQQLGADMDLFSEKSLDHRRGEFLAIPVGVSFGGGQTVRAFPGRFCKLYLTGFKIQEPGNLVHTQAMRRLIRKILTSHSILRIAGFQSSKGFYLLFLPWLNPAKLMRIQVPLRRSLQSCTGTLLKPFRLSSANTSTSNIIFLTVFFRQPALTAGPKLSPWSTPTSTTFRMDSAPSQHWGIMTPCSAAT